jgi:hypothetical protein
MHPQDRVNEFDDLKPGSHFTHGTRGALVHSRDVGPQQKDQPIGMITNVFS